MRRQPQVKDDDCFAACLASLLEIPLASVPNFCPRGSDDGEAQTAKAARWLRRKFGLTLATILIPDGKRTADVVAHHAVPARFIAVVPVNGGRDWHAVVAGSYGKRLRVLHDPAGHKRINLALANEIRFLVPSFKKGSPCRLPKSTAA